MRHPWGCLNDKEVKNAGDYYILSVVSGVTQQRGATPELMERLSDPKDQSVPEEQKGEHPGGVL